MAAPLPLSACVGFSGTVQGGLLLHPVTQQHIIYPLGSSIVIRNVHDNSDQVFLQAHTDRVTAMAISADGTMLASGQVTHMGYLASIILWDIACFKRDENGEAYVEGAPQLLHTLDLHKVGVRGLAFSPCGTYLASIGSEDDNNVVVWTVATGMALCGSPAAHDSVTCITWLHSTDALSIVTGGHKTMRVWELDPVARKVRPTEISFGKNSRDINCIAVEPGDEYIYFGTASGDVFKACPRRALAARPHASLAAAPSNPPLPPSQPVAPPRPPLPHAAARPCPPLATRQRARAHATPSPRRVQVHIAAKQYVALGPRIKFSLGISTICVHPSGALLVGSGGGEVAALDPGNLEPKLKQKVLGGVSSLAMCAPARAAPLRANRSAPPTAVTLESPPAAGTRWATSSFWAPPRRTCTWSSTRASSQSSRPRATPE